MKKFAFVMALCILAVSCTSPLLATWGDPCTRIMGKEMNCISSLGDKPITAGQDCYIKAKDGDYFVVSYQADSGTCSVEISTEKETCYQGRDLVSVFGNESTFTAKVKKRGTYKVSVSVEDFTGSVTVTKKSKD